MSRSADKIPRLRTRGRANRARLLREAERLLAENTNGSIRFSDVFEAAGVSRGSAYRIYIGMDDLLQDLAGEWLNDFIAFLAEQEPNERPATWPQLSDFIVECAARYWELTDATIRSIPHGSSMSAVSYEAAVADLGRCIAVLFDRYFVVPEIRDWHRRLVFFARLCDLSLTDAITTGDDIESQRIAEAQALCRTQLAFCLPAELPAR